MNGDRAEAYLRQLAEAELRARTLPAARIQGRRNTGSLALVEPALVAAGAVEAGPADQIRADLELAVAVRQRGQHDQAGPGGRGPPPDAQKQLAGLVHNPSRRAGTVAAYFPGLAAAYPRPAPHQAPWRVVPAGQVIPIRDGDVRSELLLVAYVHSADGAWFTMGGVLVGWQETAVDDHGARYQVECRGVYPAGLLVLRPDPPRHIRWLDLIIAPGQPATRIDLDPQVAATEVTVTRTAHSPGELLLDVIAARILCSGAVAFPQYDLEHPPAGVADLRAFIGDGPGRIVAALHASGALPPASPVPGQLAALCTRSGHPATASPRRPPRTFPSRGSTC